ncbi:glucuronate isomerase [Mycetocola tolaasinivorans]|uniref:Uronate isomerase n=1 Tax=Mycetocola tolaasinivorans TaxID=76635 RepID=A0A3L7A0T4_9MICO|nr:glucuronate isomerase [Mycetocola tolaasinivorans]RLP73684.1 glucuronate isomerase [Mycetocola tolaasinivorans]
MTQLTPNPDRLFPADPAERDIARRLYAEVATAPILSPHGHVDANLLLENEAFRDPAELLITPDHYVTRLLHAHGVPLGELGLADRGVPSSASGADIWRHFSSHWSDFAGTPVRYWFETELHDVFGITEVPSVESSDRIYAQIAERLARPEWRPRALFERFNIEVLATTDDPADSLDAHRALAADPTFAGRVLPTFRADRYMDPGAAGWRDALTALADAADIDTGTYAGLIAALKNRREYFIAHGATATDTGVLEPTAEPLTTAEAERIHAAALAGTASEADTLAYRRNMLYRYAEMAAEDGLVMQLHPGVIRGHHAPTLERFGPDTGHDLPDQASFTRPLRRILQDFGTNETFRLVLFTVDETVFSREIGPLAGFYPSVFAGAPWWFIDTPAAIARYRSAVTDSAGFAKTSGFIDDTRAFCSIPARHDMSRRADAAFLAGLVTTHQLGEDEAAVIIRDLTDRIPRSVFRL